MELVLLSGPGVEMTPTATDARAWAVAGLVCAAILLADAVVTALVRRRSGSSRWPLSVLLPPRSRAPVWCSRGAFICSSAGRSKPYMSQLR